jgi:hypothetical protein
VEFFSKLKYNLDIIIQIILKNELITTGVQVMNLEEKKVLLCRCHIIKQWHDKEWWYTGFYDEQNNIYFSFFFVRVNLIDQFSFTLFDPESNKATQFDKKLYLKKKQVKDKLCLNYHSLNLTIEYNGDEINGWSFRFKNKDYQIELDFKPSIPYFTKFDDEFTYKYTLLHFFNNRASGFIKTPQMNYTISDAMTYYDHCFGTVPSKPGWHWIAVQNSEVSLASLTNYGAYAQRYTQIYFRKNKEDYQLDKWIRLDQDVSFEYYEDKLKSDWRVTSPDMDLIVTPLMYTLDSEKIPPIVSFLVNIDHYEFFVRASGKVRVDGKWLEVNNLYGVMEEQSGKW